MSKILKSGTQTLLRHAKRTKSWGRSDRSALAKHDRAWGHKTIRQSYKNAEAK